MSHDILSQVADEIESCPSGLFDKSTNTANLAQLLIHIRCAHNDDTKTDVLFCKSFETPTTAREQHGIEWKTCVEFAVMDDMYFTDTPNKLLPLMKSPFTLDIVDITEIA
jgi:hypothetical protein